MSGLLNALGPLPWLVLIFGSARLLGISKWTVFMGSFLFGAATWCLFEEVPAASKHLVLPGALLWPWITPTCGALYWWMQQGPDRSKPLGIALALASFLLAIAGGFAAFAIYGIIGRHF